MIRLKSDKLNTDLYMPAERIDYSINIQFKHYSDFKLTKAKATGSYNIYRTGIRPNDMTNQIEICIVILCKMENNCNKKKTFEFKNKCLNYAM